MGAVCMSRSGRDQVKGTVGSYRLTLGRYRNLKREQYKLGARVHTDDENVW